MVSSGFLIVTIIIGVSFVLGTHYWRNEVQKPRDTINSRPSRSLEELYEDWEGKTAVTFAEFSEIWQVIAKKLDLPAEKLRPSDRFDFELNWMDSRFDDRSTKEEMVEWFESEMEKADKTESIHLPLHTLGELVVVLADLQKDGSGKSVD